VHGKKTLVNFCNWLQTRILYLGSKYNLGAVIHNYFDANLRGEILIAIKNSLLEKAERSRKYNFQVIFS
jgi:hypothetical protein